jgi:glycosyltransferase involved in cell wall biosynthesis
MSSKPVVSVIVPCYKQAHFLPDALTSVLAQTMQDWECIIVNDGSPDNTAAVAQEWVKRDSRFHYVDKLNGGLSSARNRGLLEARGDYTQFLDADDLIESAKFAWQTSLLRNSPDLGIVYGDVRYFPTDAPQERRFNIFGPDEPWVAPAWLEPRPFLDKLLERNLMAVNCPMIRQSVIDKIGLFDETLRAVEDWHYWLRCAATRTEFQFAPAPGTLALVRAHRVSMSQDRTRMRSETFKMRVLLGATLANSELRRKNFVFGVGLMTAHGRVSAEFQLLRLAWANRGLNIIRPFFSAHLSRDSRLFKMLSFLRKVGNENALSS